MHTSLQHQWWSQSKNKEMLTEIKNENWNCQYKDANNIHRILNYYNKLVLYEYVVNRGLSFPGFVRERVEEARRKSS